MMKKMQKKREELQAKYITASGMFQKGFTLIEMLIVILIILVVIGIMIMSFSFFGRVDGTELIAKSKNVESAVLQVALGDENRDIPALGLTGDGVGVGKPVTRADGQVSSAVVKLADSEFTVKKDAEVVITEVAKQAGLGYEDLLGLLRPVDAKVQKAVAGDVKVENYFVVVKKSQLYDSSVTAYDNYNDELSGLVFSKETIVDSENVYYNGTSKSNSKKAN